MRPKPIRRGRSYWNRRVTWRGVGFVYGMMLFVVFVMWAISYPQYAAAVLAVIVGGYAMVRFGARIVRRRARVVRVPGTDLCVTIWDRQVAKRQ